MSSLGLLRVANVIDADDIARSVLHWFIAGDIGLAQNGDRTVEGFTLGDSHARCGLKVQDGADSSRPVVLSNARRSANKLVATLHEKRCRHSFTVFSSDHVHDVKVVVDLCRAEIQTRSIFSSDGVVSFDFRLARVWPSKSLRFPSIWRLADPPAR